jgi:hypothetical protein
LEEINSGKDALGQEFQSKNLSPSQKNVVGRIVPANIQKLLIIFYSFLKMTRKYVTLWHRNQSLLEHL